MSHPYTMLTASGIVVTDEKRTAILNALKDPRYTWRTAKGIAEETKLPESEVREILMALQNEVVVPNFLSQYGDRLYASRDHLISRLGPIGQISGAFRNRVF